MRSIVGLALLVVAAVCAVDEMEESTTPSVAASLQEENTNLKEENINLKEENAKLKAANGEQDEPNENAKLRARIKQLLKASHEAPAKVLSETKLCPSSSIKDVMENGCAPDTVSGTDTAVISGNNEAPKTGASLPDPLPELANKAGDVTALLQTGFGGCASDSSGGYAAHCPVWKAAGYCGHHAWVQSVCPTTCCTGQCCAATGSTCGEEANLAASASARVTHCVTAVQEMLNSLASKKLSLLGVTIYDIPSDWTTASYICNGMVNNVGAAPYEAHNDAWFNNDGKSAASRHGKAQIKSEEFILPNNGGSNTNAIVAEAMCMKVQECYLRDDARTRSHGNLYECVSEKQCIVYKLTNDGRTCYCASGCAILDQLKPGVRDGGFNQFTSYFTTLF